MRDVTVLLTGATGFVGTHVARAFAERDVAVRALVRATSETRTLSELGAELRTARLDDTAALADALRDVDIVVHMAARTSARDEDEYQAVNAAATRVLADAAAAQPTQPRFVYLSSLAAVGPAIDPPVRADTRPAPLTAYGRSKLAGEHAVQAAGLDRAVIVRAPAVYGPRDRELLRAFRLARRGLAAVPAGGPRPLQLVHVEDLATGVANAALSPAAHGVYHLAEPTAYPWATVMSMVARAVGRTPRLVKLPAALIRMAAGTSEFASALAGRTTVFNREKALELLAPGWTCETERAETELGFQARPLQEGLDQTARWYEDHGWL